MLGVLNRSPERIALKLSCGPAYQYYQRQLASLMCARLVAVADCQTVPPAILISYIHPDIAIHGLALSNALARESASQLVNQAAAPRLCPLR